MPKLKVNTEEVDFSTEFKMLASSVADLTFYCCREFGFCVAFLLTRATAPHPCPHFIDR